MKRIIFIAVFLFATLALSAQKSATRYFYNDFYKHEVKLSLGDALLYEAAANLDVNERFYINVSIAYLYRPVKWFWIGANFINYFGNNAYYHWREYDADGNFNDFSKSKKKYCAVIAPEVRFSYLNKERVILYSSFSTGIGWENGYDYYDDDDVNPKWEKYPKTIGYLQITCFGFSVNFGEKNHIFLGGESGLGFKGLINMHGGYRF